MRLLILALVLASCATANPEAPGVGVSPTALMLAAGQTGAVTATSDGDLSSVVWSSDAPTIATVTGSGATATITGVAAGHATISALLGVVAASVDVTVTAAVVDRIDVTATAAIVPKGATSQLTATAHYTDQHTIDVTAMVAWTPADPTLASIDARGLLTGLAPGSTQVSAKLGATTGTLAIMVTSAALVSLAITDPMPSGIPVGIDHQLAAQGAFTDGTTADVTSVVGWASSSGTTASVAGGLVHGIATGTATITAMIGGVSATHAVTVIPAVIQKLAIAPGSVALALGRDQALVATGTYSDGSARDVTALATWTATGTAATVATGLVHAAAQGTSTVTAALDGATGTATATIGPAVIDHLAIPEGDVALAQQQRAHLHAVLVYSDATTTDVTTTAAWSASTGVATVAVGTVDAGTTAGSAAITASASGVMATITATVGATACHPVINEVQSAGTSPADEWVEIYNPCTISIDVTGWTLEYRAATNATGPDNFLLATLAGTLAPGDLRLYAGSGYAGTADGTWGGGASGLLQLSAGGLGLRSGPKDTGPLVDAVAYGTVLAGFPFTEGSPAPALATGKSIARTFDGNDTNTGAADFALVAAPTPRARND